MGREGLAAATSPPHLCSKRTLHPACAVPSPVPSPHSSAVPALSSPVPGSAPEAPHFLRSPSLPVCALQVPHDSSSLGSWGQGPPEPLSLLTGVALCT